MLSRKPSRLPSRRALALALGLVAATTLLPGCDPAQGEAAHGPAAMPPPEVTAVSVSPQPVAVSREYVGQTEGSRDIEVRARVTGILLERVYREGSTVEPGAPLFRI